MFSKQNTPPSGATLCTPRVSSDFDHVLPSSATTSYCRVKHLNSLHSPTNRTANGCSPHPISHMVSLVSDCGGVVGRTVRSSQTMVGMYNTGLSVFLGAPKKQKPSTLSTPPHHLCCAVHNHLSALLATAVLLQAAPCALCRPLFRCRLWPPLRHSSLQVSHNSAKIKCMCAEMRLYGCTWYTTVHLVPRTWYLYTPACVNVGLTPVPWCTGFTILSGCRAEIRRPPTFRGDLYIYGRRRRGV